MPVIPSRNVTQEDIIRTLASIRNQQDQRASYFQPQAYTDFMPNTQQGYQPQSPDIWKQNLQGIDVQGKDATATSLAIAQNKAAQEAQAAARQKKHFARQQLIAQANATATNNQAAQNSANATGPQTGAPHYNAITGQWEQPKAPALAPAKGFNINAPIVTSQWHGISLTMNKSVLPRFLHFLDALSAEGYKIKSFSSYRPGSVIAGTHQWDLHSKGLALDINPTENPVSYNGHNITNLPPNVGSLAARYGIKWGGSWIHAKRDPMHFSVPYGGVE